MATRKQQPSTGRPPDTDARDDDSQPRRGKPRPVDEMPRPVRGRPDLVPGPGGETRPIGPDLGSDTDGDLSPPHPPGNKM